MFIMCYKVSNLIYKTTYSRIDCKIIGILETELVEANFLLFVLNYST